MREKLGESSRRGQNLATFPETGRTRRVVPGAGKCAEFVRAEKLAESLPAPDKLVELFSRAGETRRVCPAPGRLAELLPRRENSPKLTHAGIAINQNIKITSRAPPPGRVHFLHPSCLCRHRARGDAPPKIINQSIITPSKNRWKQYPVENSTRPYRWTYCCVASGLHR